jgi:nitroreductase
MDVYDAMRTTFAAREYTADPVEDATLHRILDNARFAPSGGNRQGWRVLIIRDKSVRSRMKTLMQPTVQQYKAQIMAGETPFNTVKPSNVSEQDIAATSGSFPLIDNLEAAPVVLVICVDLSLVTSFDADLDRVGVISGASVYPFAWNILLAARNEGLGGVLTTFLANSEPAAKALLDIPDNFALAAMLAIGKPVKQLTRLRRNDVASFTSIDTFNGEKFVP